MHRKKKLGCILPRVRRLGGAFLDSTGTGKLFQWAYLLLVHGRYSFSARTEIICRLKGYWYPTNPLQTSSTLPTLPLPYKHSACEGLAHASLYPIAACTAQCKTQLLHNILQITMTVNTVQYMYVVPWGSRVLGI